MKSTLEISHPVIWQATFISSDQHIVTCWPEGIFIEVAVQCVTWLLWELYINVCVCASPCVSVCLRDTSFSSLPWRERGRLGSNDTGSPQHLATAPFVWMSVYECVRSRRKWLIWMCWSKWTGGDGISVWEVFLPCTKTEIIREQTILDHKNFDCSNLT